jgi:hypothetical protein
MAKTFDPKYVLRQISNHLLRDLFEARQHDLDVPWDQLSETEVDPIYKEWQALPEPDCRAIEIVLREVNEMASGDTGMRAIREEARRKGDQQLLDDLDRYESRYDCAVWTYLKGAEVWDLAVRFARADSLATGRYWIKRCELPAKAPKTRTDVIDELESAFAAFFHETQARGRHCQIEHYRRANGLDYFFAYLDDYADTYITLDDCGAFDRRPERRAFELVLVYDRDVGTLESFVHGSKKVYGPIQEIFGRVILGAEIGPENRDSHPYVLNGLLNRNFPFVTDPVDGIEEVRVRKLRLSVKGKPRRRITLEANPDGEVDDVYEMLEKYLNRSRLPLSILNVTQVGLRFRFDGTDANLPRSLSFEVSYPNSSNLRSKPQGARDLALKYLRQWGFDRAARTGDTVSAA